MAVLRIEIKEIPAQTIETAIIGIPADDWRKMKRKNVVFGTLTGVMAISLFFGLIIFSSTTWIPLARYLGLDILHNDSDAIKGAVLMMAICLPLIFAMYRFGIWVNELQFNLLKKHGWDGNSNHEVELEYQQFLHE